MNDEPTMWQVWFEPTQKGKEAFNWEARPLGEPINNPDDASFECYLAKLEEPSPDFTEFGRYVVRPISRQHKPNLET